MPRRKRPGAVIAGAREARSIAANLGGHMRTTRRRRRLTQAALGDLVGLGQSEISHLEHGHGAGTSVETWVAIGIALGRPIAIGFSRDVVAPLNDAGHLEAQEVVARVAAESGWRVTFETPSGPANPGLSSDLQLVRDATVLVEVWNRVDDLGAAARSSDRKFAAAPAATRSCWLLVDTAANRTIVRRFPAILRARFPGSSEAWVRALTTDAPAPSRPGIAWIELSSRRLRPLRHAAG